MSGTCTWLGIYPEQIEDAGETLDACCKEYGIDADEVWDWVLQEFRERYGLPFHDHISNAIVGIIFDCAKEALCRKGVDDVDYYVNGTLDTNFYIGGELI